MKARRWCPESSTRLHQPTIRKGDSVESVRGYCRECGVELRKSRDGVWYEILMPEWIPWAVLFVVTAAAIATAVAWWTT